MSKKQKYAFHLEKPQKLKKKNQRIEKFQSANSKIKT